MHFIENERAMIFLYVACQVKISDECNIKLYVKLDFILSYLKEAAWLNRGSEMWSTRLTR